ncbi:MAG: amidohydrolase family protein [Pseudomonadota bacterium]
MSYFRKLINIIALPALLVAFLSSCQQSMNEKPVINVDIGIISGDVIDGTGSAAKTLDIGIVDDRIVYMGTDKILNAKRTINAKNLIVSPGFIDGHSHSDEFVYLKENRLNESALFQGVTTFVGGADGFWSPEELRSLLAAYKKNGIGTNVAFYIGHNGIRKAVMGEAKRFATKPEMEKMKALVEEGMQMGALGLSTGLMYSPGDQSNTEEVIELAKVAAKYGGIYDSHVRDPINALLDSDREVIRIAREANIDAKIGHVKAVCQRNAGLSKDIIQMVEKARAKGINIVTDQYPYDGAKTDFLSSLVNVSTSLKEQDNYSLNSALSDPVLYAQLKNNSEHGIDGNFSWLKVLDYDCIRITYSEDYPELVGQYIDDLARKDRVDGFKMIQKLLHNAKKPIRVTFGGVLEKDVQAILVMPWNLIVSDGYYVNDASPDNIHPRSTGTFTRILGHYVRDLKLLNLEEAIRKMTYAPAQFLHLPDRGHIARGAFADIVIFDKKSVRDRSSWSEPKHYAEGIKFVIINGQLAIDKSELTGNASGRYVPRSKSIN